MIELSALRAVCEPPAAPTSTSYSWADAEREVGFRLPKDYKDLVETYGRGGFARFLHVFQPDSTFPAIDVCTAPVEILDTLRTFEGPGFVVLGDLDLQMLFPVAVSDNGNYVFWRMDPREVPELWDIVVNEPRGERWYFFKGNLTEFLTAVLSGDHVVPMFPRDLLEESVVFDVY